MITATRFEFNVHKKCETWPALSESWPILCLMVASRSIRSLGLVSCLWSFVGETPTY